MTVPMPVRLRYPRAVICGLVTVVAVAVACDAAGSPLPSAPKPPTAISLQKFSGRLQKFSASCVSNDGLPATEPGALVMHVAGASHSDWVCAVPDGMQISVVTPSGQTRSVTVTRDMSFAQAVVVKLQKHK